MCVTIALVTLHTYLLRYDDSTGTRSKVVRCFQLARVSRVRRHSDSRAMTSHPILQYNRMQTAQVEKSERRALINPLMHNSICTLAESYTRHNLDNKFMYRQGKWLLLVVNNKIMVHQQSTNLDRENYMNKVYLT